MAYHEAGHAIAGWFLEHADPLLKVTCCQLLTDASRAAAFLISRASLTVVLNVTGHRNS